MRSTTSGDDLAGASDVSWPLFAIFADDTRAYAPSSRIWPGLAAAGLHGPRRAAAGRPDRDNHLAR
jgi:hypothetical protein